MRFLHCTFNRGLTMKTISILKLFLLLLLFSFHNLVFASSGGGGGAASKFFQLSPQIVVNITDQGKVRHLQIAIQLRLEDPADTNIVKEHTPAIQHELNMLLSGREAKDVRSTQGKEALRAEATEKLKKILEENTGRPIITTVYFTAFVIQ